MSLLQVSRLRLENFRCFAALDATFEPDLTVLFAENGGGKTALLTALAMGFSLLQPRQPKETSLQAERDARRVRGKGGLREPVGACTVECTANIGAVADVTWSVTASPTSRRRDTKLGDVSDAIERVRQPGERWPLIAFYDTGRFSSERKAGSKGQEFQDRWDGYAACLDPQATDGPLLDWLKGEAAGDRARRDRGEAERGLYPGVLDAMKRATPEVAKIWYDPIDGVVVSFQGGAESTWGELSDGFHVFMALVGDIARRAVILNSQDGAEAPLLVEGVVLVDEIDLHLHPRWQRVVLGGLRKAFPKLQFIVTTHSPQVLSSIENRQVRRLVNGGFSHREVLVEGRDSNAILRDLMSTDDRDERGNEALRELYALIDGRQVEEARAKYQDLIRLWGSADPAVIRAGVLLDDAIAEDGG